MCLAARRAKDRFSSPWRRDRSTCPGDVMPSLRNRLIAAFVFATLLPLAATIWIATSLIERSLGYAHIADLDRVSRTLETTARQFYQREREALKQDAAAGRIAPTRFAAADRSTWPDAVREFRESAEPERVVV